jgi:hypothetical protein
MHGLLHDYALSNRPSYIEYTSDLLSKITGNTSNYQTWVGNFLAGVGSVDRLVYLGQAEDLRSLHDMAALFGRSVEQKEGTGIFGMQVRLPLFWKYAGSASDSVSMMMVGIERPTKLDDISASVMQKHYDLTQSKIDKFNAILSQEPKSPQEVLKRDIADACLTSVIGYELKSSLGHVLFRDSNGPKEHMYFFSRF